jgi:hypothetical protein
MALYTESRQNGTSIVMEELYTNLRDAPVTLRRQDKQSPEP